ncbi:hypothetical protein PGH12_04650 [Chryseobacterium wangxinyae]|uniref:hypothetical protein n=1 Tax=Chryseobacterium sp. CY350 TaxID=2997336 RepID=UPI0022734C3F|nr:hypothetical protein [Chryseobacterium sp. CY350]MCY0979411.1 hypothetical protein [Chryseobacterium sp. CY350]WBZ96439.1 hypothetical protein PGH12_04650 [Chryseobacterium sp. CY350]
MRYIILFIYIIASSICFSCQTKNVANDIISKNKKLYNSLYKSNGNVFSLGSLSFEHSYMWSYSNDEINIYNLEKGKVISEKKIKLQNQGNNRWLQNPLKDDTGIDNCIATDGFTLMYKVVNNDSYIERRFPVMYDCMKNSKYETDFFTKLIEDMNYYQIGWLRSNN